MNLALFSVLAGRVRYVECRTMKCLKVMHSRLIRMFNGCAFQQLKRERFRHFFQFYLGIVVGILVRRINIKFLIIQRELISKIFSN